MVEYISAKCGAINCDDSTLLGYDSDTGESLHNLQAYAGERIYKSPYFIHPMIGMQASKLLTRIMRSKYLSDSLRWIARDAREPQYLSVLPCMLCKLKGRLIYCATCSASLCLVCGVLSACACNYGMDEMVGAHDWYESWIESH